MEPKKKFKRYTFGNSSFLWQVLRWKRKMRKNKI